MKKISFLKLFLGLSLFFIVIRFANVNIHLNYLNFKIFLSLLFSLFFSITLITLRTNLVYNTKKILNFYQLYLFNIYSWSLNNIFISAISEIFKFNFYRKISKINLVSYIFLEKITVIFSLIILIIFYFLFLFYLNLLTINLIYLIIIIFLSLLIFYCAFKSNFLLQRIPYLNLFNFNLNTSIKTLSSVDYFKLILINLCIHLVSFLNLFIILSILKIKLSLIILLFFYFFYYLSGIFQIFPSGLGIRELLFLFYAYKQNLNTNDFLNVSVTITSFNIFLSFVINVFLFITMKKNKLFNFNSSART